MFNFAEHMAFQEHTDHNITEMPLALLGSLESRLEVEYLE